jgi:hypothetical protein
MNFEQYLNERIGDAAVSARKMGLNYYGDGYWGKDNIATHQQSGTDILTKLGTPKKMKGGKFPESNKVNAVAKKSGGWKMLGQGAQSSVWKHADNDNDVVKISGGGRSLIADDQETDLAYIHFLMDHGKHYPHLPVIIDIDTSHPHILQIRMEKLTPLPDDVAELLQDLASQVDGGNRKYIEDASADLEEELENGYPELHRKNVVADIVDTIRVLKKNQGPYRRKYGSYVGNNDGLDLHSGNWLMAVDKRIIAADPWYGG